MAGAEIPLSGIPNPGRRSNVVGLPTRPEDEGEAVSKVLQAGIEDERQRITREAVVDQELARKGHRLAAQSIAAKAFEAASEVTDHTQVSPTFDKFTIEPLRAYADTLSGDDQELFIYEAEAASSHYNARLSQRTGLLRANHAEQQLIADLENKTSLAENVTTAIDQGGAAIVAEAELAVAAGVPVQRVDAHVRKARNDIARSTVEAEIEAGNTSGADDALKKMLGDPHFAGLPGDLVTDLRKKIKAGYSYEAYDYWHSKYGDPNRDVPQDRSMFALVKLREDDVITLEDYKKGLSDLRTKHQSASGDIDDQIAISNLLQGIVQPDADNVTAATSLHLDAVQSLEDPTDLQSSLSIGLDQGAALGFYSTLVVDNARALLASEDAQVRASTWTMLADHFGPEDIFTNTHATSGLGDLLNDMDRFNVTRSKGARTSMQATLVMERNEDIGAGVGDPNIVSNLDAWNSGWGTNISQVRWNKDLPISAADKAGMAQRVTEAGLLYSPRTTVAHVEIAELLQKSPWRGGYDLDDVNGLGVLIDQMVVQARDYFLETGDRTAPLLEGVRRGLRGVKIQEIRGRPTIVRGDGQASNFINDVIYEGPDGQEINAGVNPYIHEQGLAALNHILTRGEFQVEPGSQAARALSIVKRVVAEIEDEDVLSSGAYGVLGESMADAMRAPFAGEFAANPSVWLGAMFAPQIPRDLSAARINEVPPFEFTIEIPSTGEKRDIVLPLNGLLAGLEDGDVMGLVENAYKMAFEQLGFTEGMDGWFSTNNAVSDLIAGWAGFAANGERFALYPDNWGVGEDGLPESQMSAYFENGRRQPIRHVGGNVPVDFAAHSPNNPVFISARKLMGEKVFEDSPEMKILDDYAAGTKWIAGHTAKDQYEQRLTTEIKRWVGGKFDDFASTDFGAEILYQLTQPVMGKSAGELLEEHTIWHGGDNLEDLKWTWETGFDLTDWKPGGKFEDLGTQGYEGPPDFPDPMVEHEGFIGKGAQRTGLKLLIAPHDYSKWPLRWVVDYMRQAHEKHLKNTEFGHAASTPYDQLSVLQGKGLTDLINTEWSGFPTSSNGAPMLRVLPSDDRFVVIPTVIDGKQHKLEDAAKIAAEKGLENYPTLRSEQHAFDWVQRTRGDIDRRTGEWHKDRRRNAAEDRQREKREIGTARPKPDLIDAFERIDPDLGGGETVTNPLTGNAVVWAKEKYNGTIYDAAREHGIDPLLLKAQMQAESNYDNTAESPVGAKGLMQFMDETREDTSWQGGSSYEPWSPFDPEVSIRKAAQYMAWHMRRPGITDWGLALIGYNQGVNKTIRLIREGKVEDQAEYDENGKKVKDGSEKEALEYRKKIMGFYEQLVRIRNMKMSMAASREIASQ